MMHFTCVLIILKSDFFFRYNPEIQVFAIITQVIIESNYNKIPEIPVIKLVGQFDAITFNHL